MGRERGVERRWGRGVGLPEERTTAMVFLPVSPKAPGDVLAYFFSATWTQTDRHTSDNQQLEPSTLDYAMDETGTQAGCIALLHCSSS